MNRNLLFVAIALFMLWGVGEGMFFNFVPIRLETEFLLSKQQMGFALGAFGFFMAITHIPGGHLADRIGRRPLLITAWLLGVVSTLTMGLAKSLPLYLVGLFLYGVTAFVASPLSSYVTAARGKWEVGTALSLTTATYNLGMALGPVSGGWIAEHYGMNTSYLVAFGIFVVSSMLFMVFIEPQPIDKHDPAAPPPNLWNNTRFISFVMVFAFAIFAMYLSQPLTPNFSERRAQPIPDRNGLDIFCWRVGKFPAGVCLQPCQTAKWIFGCAIFGGSVCRCSSGGGRGCRSSCLAISCLADSARRARWRWRRLADLSTPRKWDWRTARWKLSARSFSSSPRRLLALSLNATRSQSIRWRWG